MEWGTLMGNHSPPVETYGLPWEELVYRANKVEAIAIMVMNTSDVPYAIQIANWMRQNTPCKVWLQLITDNPEAGHSEDTWGSAPTWENEVALIEESLQDIKQQTGALDGVSVQCNLYPGRGAQQYMGMLDAMNLTQLDTFPLIFNRVGTTPILTKPLLADELIWASVIRTDTLIPEDSLMKYYLYASPHNEAGTGVYLYGSNSLDGPWELYSETPIVAKEIVSGATHISSPFIIWNDDTSEFHLYFHASRTYQETFLATSSDGITFTLSGSTPVIPVGAPSAWDYWATSYACVLKDGATWRMIYSGVGESEIHVGYATSADGITWTKQGPLTLGGAPGEEVGMLLKVDGVYYIFESRPADIYLWSSTDLITWTPGGVVLPSKPGAWDAGTVGYPTIIQSDVNGAYYMFYVGMEYTFAVDPSVVTANIGLSVSGISIGDDTLLSDVTFEFGVKLDSYGESDGVVLFSKQQAGHTDCTFEADIMSTGELLVCRGTTYANQDVWNTDTGLISLDTPYHITVSWESGTGPSSAGSPVPPIATIWENGNDTPVFQDYMTRLAVGTGDWSSDAGYPMILGTYALDVGYTFIGTWYYFKVHNTILTLDEKTENYLHEKWRYVGMEEPSIETISPHVSVDFEAAWAYAPHVEAGEIEVLAPSFRCSYRDGQLGEISTEVNLETLECGETEIFPLSNILTITVHLATITNTMAIFDLSSSNNVNIDVPVEIFLDGIIDDEVTLDGVIDDEITLDGVIDDETEMDGVVV